MIGNPAKAVNHGEGASCGVRVGRWGVAQYADMTGISRIGFNRLYRRGRLK